MSASAGEDVPSIVTSNGKGSSRAGLPHRPLSAKESGAYDHLETSETFRYVHTTYDCSYRICDCQLLLILQPIDCILFIAVLYITVERMVCKGLTSSHALSTGGLHVYVA